MLSSLPARCGYFRRNRVAEGHLLRQSHSTEIDLYTFSQDNEKSTRCTVTDLPPALVAEAPEPADISLGGEKTVGRCAPFVERGHVRCAGLRAPPVLA